MCGQGTGRRRCLGRSINALDESASSLIDIYTIIFLAVAVLIFLRLRSVLGRRTGNERPPFDPYSRREAPPPAANGEDNVIGLPRREATDDMPPDLPEAPQDLDVDARLGTTVAEDSAIRGALARIARADSSFDVESFISGSKAAYEMIVTAFAEGDRKMLRQLLSRDVYEGFIGAIDQREEQGETIEFRFIGIDRADITGAELKNRSAQVTVRFLSKLVSATHDKDGELVDGDPIHVSEHSDIWTFAREVTSRNPNWKLVATESVE